MANLPQQNTINQYLADGVEDQYTYTYLILLDTDINVYVTPQGQAPDPVADLQVLNTDYTVAGMGTVTGGIVTFINIPPNNSVVTLTRDIGVSIDTNFAYAQNFNGQNLDDAFERVTLYTQQTSTVLNERALQYEINTYLPNAASNFVPVLGNGQVWSGLDGAVVATTIETDPDISLLRSQLESETPLAEGALLVGYYDTIAQEGEQLGVFLDYKDVFGNDSGAADAMVLTIANSNFKYANGQTIHIIPANTNLTTTPTINVNGLGAVVIRRNPTSPAQAGDIQAGSVIDLIYDANANYFYIINLFIPTIASANPTFQQLSGSGTYTPPVGCTYIVVEGVGGGGGSGGAQGAGTIYGANTGGGGAGGYFKKLISSLDPSYAYAVGAGGTAGSTGAGNGGTGGTTTFGTLSATGGVGSNGFVSNGFAGLTRAGGNGGTATGGDINIAGDPGGSGRLIAISPTSGYSGYGAASQLGTVSKEKASTNGNVTGGAGVDYGSGASGSCVNTNAGTGNLTGAAGSDGVIYVWEYYA